MFNKKLIFTLGVCFCFSATEAAESVVSQKNKKFEPLALTIKVGDSVNFKNDDSFNHNVFSLSDTKTFDLGSYPGGASKSIVFDKAGTVDVECAIHPEMKMTITVNP